MKHLLNFIFLLGISIAFSKSVIAQEQRNGTKIASTNEINDQIAHVPYIFEGVIEKVEIFAGDKSGNKLPNSAARWENGIAYFYQPDGSEAIGYSLATIKLCKIYKGSDIESEDKVCILTTSQEMQVFQQIYNGDTILNYTYFKASHGPYTRLFFPNKAYNKIIYFCKKSVYLTNSSIQNKGKLLSLYEVNDPFSIVFDVQNPIRNKNGTETNQIVYAALLNKYSIDKIFKTREELSSFLSKYSTLNVNAKDKCVEKKNDSLNEVFAK